MTNIEHVNIPFTADQVASYVLFENATILSTLGTEALYIAEAVGSIFEALLAYVPEDASVAFPIDMSIYKRLQAAADKGFFEALAIMDAFDDEDAFQEAVADEADDLDEDEILASIQAEQDDAS